MKTPTIAKLLEIINQKLVDCPITEEDMELPLDKAGLDSIGFIHIIVAIEEEYECEIPDSKLILSELDTAKKIHMLLCSLAEEES